MTLVGAPFKAQKAQIAYEHLLENVTSKNIRKKDPSDTKCQLTKISKNQIKKPTKSDLICSFLKLEMSFSVGVVVEKVRLFQ